MHIWLPVIRSNTGTDVFSIRLYNALNQRGVRCTITWYNRYFELFPWLLSRVVIPDGIDIIHANSWNAFTFHRKNTPLIVTEHLNVHNPEADTYKSFKQSLYHRYIIKKFEEASFRRADTITTVSFDSQMSLRKSFGLSEIKVLPTWINSSIFVPSKNSRYLTPPFRLLFVGKTSRRKGWDLVIRIMKALGPDFHLYFTGEPATTNSIAAPMNMTPVGRIRKEKEMVALYQKCDALLCPSRLEGLSQAVLEAMSCGLPVITSNRSSMPELITHGHSGFLCNSEDVDCYVNALKGLFKNPALFRSLSNNARQATIQRYDEDIIMKKYISLYKSFI